MFFPGNFAVFYLAPPCRRLEVCVHHSSWRESCNKVQALSAFPAWGDARTTGSTQAWRTIAMTAQTEFVSKAFDDMFENFRKATESTLQMQQDLFRQWTAGFPK